MMIVYDHRPPVETRFIASLMNVVVMFGVLLTCLFMRRDDMRRDKSRLYKVDGCCPHIDVLITVPSVETRFIASLSIACPMDVVLIFFCHAGQ